jgi:hypothetical protein
MCQSPDFYTKVENAVDNLLWEVVVGIESQKATSAELPWHTIFNADLDMLPYCKATFELQDLRSKADYGAFLSMTRIVDLLNATEKEGGIDEEQMAQLVSRQLGHTKNSTSIWLT